MFSDISIYSLSPPGSLKKSEKDIHKKTNISGATKIELKDLSPYSIGQLLSLWENKTIFNSIFWNINAFDQWGVELGKINTKKQL